MKLKYIEGPETVNLGLAGAFVRGEIRDVEDDIAERLLKKESLKFIKIKNTADEENTSEKSKRRK